MQDIHITGNSIDSIIEQLDNIIGPWKVRKQYDGQKDNQWKPVSYALQIWSDLRRCWIFENNIAWWSYNVPAPTPDKVLVITNAYGPYYETAIKNQKLCSETAGYSYVAYRESPPVGNSPNWSKITAIVKALEECNTDIEQIIWLDADILFTRQISFGKLFPVSDITCGWYIPAGYLYAEHHTDGIANGCMFSLSTSQINKNIFTELLDTCYKDTYCQQYPFEEIALKRIYNNSNIKYKFDHMTITPHSIEHDREDKHTGIHHCVSGMNRHRQQGMEDTHKLFLHNRANNEINNSHK